jgi:hypothetical protein
MSAFACIVPTGNHAVLGVNMKKIDEYYIGAGFAFLLFGMVFGMWLGASENLQFGNSHAHANLVGFVLSVLFGLIYRFFPAMKQSRLAKPQFWIYEIGAVLFVAGKIRVDATTNSDLVIFGSIVVLVGTLLMAIVFFKDREPKAG